MGVKRATRSIICAKSLFADACNAQNPVFFIMSLNQKLYGFFVSRWAALFKICTNWPAFKKISNLSML